MQPVLYCHLSISFLFILAVSCKNQESDSADVKIAGGIAADGKFGYTHLLEVGKNPRRICTGVAVSDSTMLAAGHCLKLTGKPNAEAKELEVGMKLLVSGKQARKIFAWPALMQKERISEGEAAYDLAVIQFDKNTFNEKAPLSFKGVKMNDEVVIAGYGAVGFTEEEIKNNRGQLNYGKNRVFGIKGDQLIKLQQKMGTESFDRALASLGDSGGPMLKDGKLVGLAVGLYFSDASGRELGVTEDEIGYPLPVTAGAETVSNIFVNLASDISRKLLSFAVSKGADIPGVNKAKSKASRQDMKMSALPQGIGTGTMIAICGGGDNLNLNNRNAQILENGNVRLNDSNQFLQNLNRFDINRQVLSNPQFVQNQQVLQQQQLLQTPAQSNLQLLALLQGLFPNQGFNNGFNTGVNPQVQTGFNNGLPTTNFSQFSTFNPAFNSVNSPFGVTTPFVETNNQTFSNDGSNNSGDRLDPQVSATDGQRIFNSNCVDAGCHSQGERPRFSRWKAWYDDNFNAAQTPIPQRMQPVMNNLRSAVTASDNIALQAFLRN